MKMKKILATLLMGLFVLTGALIPSITYANPADNQQPDPKHGPDFMVQEICTNFNLDRDEVSKYLHQGVNPHDMMIAASIAKVGNKSLTEVLSIKTLSNTWNDVEQSVGVTQEQIHELHQDMMATKIAKDLSVSKDAVLDLMKSGYMPHDIAVAEMLSKETQKTTTDILSMKQINNKWSDVAQSLGIDNDTFKQDLEKNRIMPGPGLHRHAPAPFGGPENMCKEPPAPIEP